MKDAKVIVNFWKQRNGPADKGSALFLRILVFLTAVLP